jgi:hypothetical protein
MKGNLLRIGITTGFMVPCSIWAILLIHLSIYSALGQVTTGSIVGTARDSSGATAPGTTITVTNVRTNSTRKDVTDANGDYVVSALPPSDYSVKAEKTGFKTFFARQITLPVGAEIRLDIALEVGLVSEQVTIEATAALLETESTALSQVMNQKRIVDLPLNGRNFLELAAYPPEPFPRWPTAAPNMETATNTSLWAAVATHRPII